MAVPDTALAVDRVYEFRVRYQYTNFDQEFTTVTNWIFGVATPPLGSTLQTLMSGLVDQWRAKVRPALPNTARYGRYELREFGGRAPKLTTPTTYKMLGLNVIYQEMDVTSMLKPDQGGVDVDDDELLPPYVSVGILRRTNKPIHGGSSVIRLGPVPESFQEDGLLTDAALTLYQGTLDFFGNDDVTLVGIEVAAPVIFQRTAYLNAVADPGGPASSTLDIGEATVNRFLGSQDTRRHPTSRVGY